MTEALCNVATVIRGWRDGWGSKIRYFISLKLLNKASPEELIYLQKVA